MGTIVKLADWPVVKTETNRERIIRALRETDGVVPQCFNKGLGTGEFVCALGAIRDGLGLLSAYGSIYRLGVSAAVIVQLNDGDNLTFAQIADRLEADDSYWNEKGDDVWER